MNYEIENYRYLDQIIIEMRYVLLSLILPICFIANDYFGRGLCLGTVKNISMYFAVIVVAVPIHANKKYKLNSRNYLNISNNEITIAFGQHTECIPISSISRCVIYNICGNINFVIYHSEKTSCFLLNGLNEEFVPKLSRFLNGIEVNKASFYETMKYIVKSFGKS